MMTLSEFNASLPKKEDVKLKEIDFYKEKCYDFTRTSYEYFFRKEI